MKLYKRLERVVGPKNVTHFVRDYLIADTETQVFQHIDTAANWVENYTAYPDDGYLSPQQLMEIRGDINDENADYGDAYYGLTLRGWDEGQDISENDAEVLIKLGIATDLR